MDMTVSMFDGYLQRMPLVRAERMMDMSQAVFYSHITKQSQNNLWNSWMKIVHRVNAYMVHRDALGRGKNPITWNGKAVSIKGLINVFAQTFGTDSVK